MLPLALLGHHGVWHADPRWHSFPYYCIFDLSFCASVVFLEGLVGYCYCVGCLVSSPSVGNVTVGIAVLEAAEFESMDALLEFPLELAYDVCLVLHFLKLFCDGTFGPTVLDC